MTVDATTVGAAFTGATALLGAVAALLKVWFSRPRLPVAEELLEQLDELRGDVLALSRWAHRARAQAAAAGIELEEPPEVLRGAGERDGERGHDPDAHGWRSSVRAQTGPQRAVRGDERRGPHTDTMPNRRAQRPAPPTMRG